MYNSIIPDTGGTHYPISEIRDSLAVPPFENSLFCFMFQLSKHVFSPLFFDFQIIFCCMK